MSYKKCLISMMLGLTMLFIIVQAGFCLEWQTANQITIGWNEVTTLVDGSPVPQGNSISYNVYLVNAITDPNKTNPVLLTTSPISELEYTMTLNTEGKFFVGVESVRYNENQEMVGKAPINWSDVNGESTPNPFGVRYYVLPEETKNLHVK